MEPNASRLSGPYLPPFTPRWPTGTGEVPFLSQKGQDEFVLMEVFDAKRRGLKRNGYFVDLACADGVRINNTLFMERHLGWRGLLIEPNPHFHESVRAHRVSPLCTDCIASTQTEVEFRIDNAMLGGIVGEGYDNSEAVRGEELANAEIIRLRTRPLAEVLEEHGAPAEIDYLSLDVEGAELEVLRAFPFDRYRFSCITIERPPFELDLLLDEHGYTQVRLQQYDTFYVHRDILPETAVRMDTRLLSTPPKEW